ncbi:MAG: ABC transporter substrate-binding protein [Janthinobacterium lividum]
MGEPARVLAGAVAQGLVRFDAGGQIEAGIAERWTVIDNGTSYIFRLRDTRWRDGSPVTAGQVVAVLRRQLARNSRNPLAPFLSAVEDVVEMTPEVIEIRLSRPRPDLLRLFAQPELAIMVPRQGGSGPFQPVGAPDAAKLLLRPARDPVAANDDAPRLSAAEDVRLRADHAANAILRFAAHRIDLVAGGSLADWPLLSLAEIAPANVRVDPAAGLLGLAIVDRDGFLADAANRDALASIFDRPAIAAAFGGIAVAEGPVPDALDSAAAPTLPGWTDTPLDQRRASTRAVVAAWIAAHPAATPAGTPPIPGQVSLRLALPPGPGGTVLWGQLASALLSVGITPVRVAADAPADLRLVDEVAPYDSARWYLATACRPCGEQAQASLERARSAPTLASRGEALAEADRAVAADVPFITLARPLRWSLVALRLRGWQPNARAWHPLNHLRDGPT